MKAQTSTQNNATGEVLRAIRRTLDLSIGDVHRRTGIAKSTLSAYETGKRTVAPAKLLKIVSTYSSELIVRTEGAR